MQSKHDWSYAVAVVAAVMLAMPVGLFAAGQGDKAGSGGFVIDDLDRARELGMLAGRKDSSVAKAFIDFSRARDQFSKAALIGASHGKPGEMASLIAKEGDRKLAAAVLAADAMANFYFAENQAGTIYKNIEEARARAGVDVAGESGKKRGKATSKYGGKSSVKKSSGASLVGELLQDGDAETVRLALMAAAYSGDDSLKARVASMTVAGSAMAGAVLLYRVRVGDKLSDEEVAALFMEAMKAPASSYAGGGMGGFTLDVPGGVMACQAVGIRKGGQALLPLLHSSLASPDLRVQVEAARAIGATGSPESVPVLTQKLAVCPWPVLVEVARALGSIPDAQSIPALIARLRTEKGRFRLDLAYALSSIVGEQKGRTAEEWESWWRKVGQTFQPDPSVTQAFRQKNRVQDMVVPSLGYFYSLPIYSDRLCFVVDSSQSMRGDRIASLRANLTQAVQSMSDGVAYNIVNFGGVIEVLRRGTLVRDKKSGFRRIEEMGHSSGTRSYDAMEVGARMEEVDTIYFLSDGKPTPSQVSDWNEIRRAIVLCDRQRPVAFHVVEFNPEGNTEPMVEMSDENYGLYEAVVLSGVPEEMDTSPPVAKEPQGKKKAGGKVAPKKR